MKNAHELLSIVEMQANKIRLQINAKKKTEQMAFSHDSDMEDQ